MPILTKTVKIKMNTKTVEYYKSLGYKIPLKKASKNYQKTYNKEYVYDFNTPIEIKVEHLTKGCKANIEVVCDFCKENTIIVSYQTYHRVVEKTGNYVCKDCAKKKQQLTSLQKYGTLYYTCTDEFKEKVSKVIFDKYGCENISQSPIVKDKKTRTFYQNSSQKSSRQQRYLCKLYQGVLNYPVKFYSADIYLPEDNLICEFDGSGHMLNLTLGRETEEEYNQKEIIRYNVIKREGYKQMRIISTKDLLPIDTTLLLMLEQAREYFSKNPERSWIEFNIDDSTIRNADHKLGVYFNYGELRRISKEDIENDLEEVSDTEEQDQPA